MPSGNGGSSIVGVGGVVGGLVGLCIKVTAEGVPRRFHPDVHLGHLELGTVGELGELRQLSFELTAPSPRLVESLALRPRLGRQLVTPPPQVGELGLDGPETVRDHLGEPADGDRALDQLDLALLLVAERGHRLFEGAAQRPLAGGHVGAALAQQAGTRVEQAPAAEQVARPPIELGRPLRRGAGPLGRRGGRLLQPRELALDPLAALLGGGEPRFQLARVGGHGRQLRLGVGQLPGAAVHGHVGRPLAGRVLVRRPRRLLVEALRPRRLGPAALVVRRSRSCRLRRRRRLPARLLVEGVGRPSPGRSQLPSRAGEAIAVAADHHEIRVRAAVRDGRVEHRLPVPVRPHRAPQQTVEQLLHGLPLGPGQRRPGSHVQGDRLADRQGPVGGRCDGISSDLGVQHRPAAAVAVQRVERGAGVAAAVHDHRPQGVADGRLDRRLPALLDLHDVEERAQDAGAAGQPLGPGLRPDLLQRLAQRLRPGLPGPRRRVSVAPGHLGRAQPFLGGPPLAVRLGDGPGQLLAGRGWRTPSRPAGAAARR